MEPIISPWFIYAIGIAGNIREVFVAMCIVYGLSIGAYLFFHVLEGDIDKHTIKARHIILLAILMVFTGLLPTKETMIGMAVAQNITEDRVIKTGKVIYAAKDDLKKDMIDIMMAISKAEKEK